jgi:hypothetical protein
VNPDDVGFPLLSGQFLKLEVHLDNPEGAENVEVSVGFRVYYTEDPRYGIKLTLWVFTTTIN